MDEAHFDWRLMNGFAVAQPAGWLRLPGQDEGHFRHQPSAFALPTFSETRANLERAA